MAFFFTLFFSCFFFPFTSKNLHNGFTFKVLIYIFAFWQNFGNKKMVEGYLSPRVNGIPKLRGLRQWVLYLNWISAFALVMSTLGEGILEITGPWGLRPIIWRMPQPKGVAWHKAPLMKAHKMLNLSIYIYI